MRAGSVTIAVATIVLGAITSAVASPQFASTFEFYRDGSSQQLSDETPCQSK